MADQYDIRDVSFLLTYDNRDCVVSRSNSILYSVSMIMLIYCAFFASIFLLKK
jgi:hypothetical protein